MPRVSTPIPIKLAVAIFIAAVVPSLALVFFEYRQLVDESKQHATDLLISRAQERSRQLSQHMERLRAVAADLAESELMRGFLRGVAEGDAAATEEFGRHAEDVVRTAQGRHGPWVDHVFVADAEGTIVLSPPRGEYEGAFRAPRVGDAALRARTGSHLGDAVRDAALVLERRGEGTLLPPERAGPDAYYLVVHPVKDDGAMVGLVAMEISLESLQEVLTEGFSLGRSGRVFLAGPSADDIVAVRPGLRAALERDEPVAGVFEFEGGALVCGVYLPVPGGPWAVCIEIDAAEVIDPLRERRASLVPLVVALCGVLAIAGAAIGLHFGLPLRRLVRDADQIAAGRLDHPIRTTRRGDEIGRLQNAIERMRVSLIGQIETLDEHVRQRTAEIEAAHERMAETQERFELAVRGSRDAIFDWNVPEGRVVLSSRWQELLADPDLPESVDIGRFFDLADPEHRERVRRELCGFAAAGADRHESEVLLLRRDGQEVWGLCRAAAVRGEDGRARRISGSIADITEIKRTQDSLRELAETDRLTGLANRTLVHDRIEHALARTRRHGTICAVAFFDFDRFKVINDSLGHDTGDALLVSIADRLRAHVREVDTAARVGGDEFVVLFEDLATPEDALAIARKLLGVFREPHDIDGHRVVSTASIGLVTSERGYRVAAEMLRDADAAMYQAKARGKGRVVVFDQEMHVRAVERLSLEEDLRGADERGELALVYQPIVALADGRFVGAESLLRWNHPTRGLVPPDRFIPIAEETGLIIPIGLWVLEHACAQIAAWKGTGLVPEGFALAVNVSKQQLLADRFCARVLECVQRHGLEVTDIKIEVTETTIVDNRSSVSRVLDELRSHRVTVSMDDFGTGHSSLSGLHLLPIDEIKIDQSFIRPADRSRKLIAITSAIVGLAEHLGLRTVGEGVESIEHVSTLQSLGCQYGQGYYFSRPVSAEAFAALLAERGARWAA